MGKDHSFHSPTCHSTGHLGDWTNSDPDPRAPEGQLSPLLQDTRISVIFLWVKDRKITQGHPCFLAASHCLGPLAAATSLASIPKATASEKPFSLPSLLLPFPPYPAKITAWLPIRVAQEAKSEAPARGGRGAQQARLNPSLSPLSERELCSLGSSPTLLLEHGHGRTCLGLGRKEL